MKNFVAVELVERPADTAVAAVDQKMPLHSVVLKRAWFGRGIE